jgi:hypothetical protein
MKQTQQNAAPIPHEASRRNGNAVAAAPTINPLILVPRKRCSKSRGGDGRCIERATAPRPHSVAIVDSIQPWAWRDSAATPRATETKARGPLTYGKRSPESRGALMVDAAMQSAAVIP